MLVSRFSLESMLTVDWPSKSINVIGMPALSWIEHTISCCIKGTCTCHQNCQRSLCHHPWILPKSLLLCRFITLAYSLTLGSWNPSCLTTWKFLPHNAHLHNAPLSCMCNKLQFCFVLSLICRYFCGGKSNPVICIRESVVLTRYFSTLLALSTYAHSFRKWVSSISFHYFWLSDLKLSHGVLPPLDLMPLLVLLLPL